MPAAVVAFIAAIGVPGLLTSAGGLTFLGGIVSAGIGIGLNFVVSLLAPKPKAPTPQDVKNVIRSSAAYRSRHYGTGKWGGVLAFIETYEGTLYMVICLGDGRVDGYDNWYADDRLLTLDVDGWATNEPYDGESIRIIPRHGVNPQPAFQELIDDFPAGTWTEDHRLDDIPCVLAICKGVASEDFNSVYPNRIPTINAIGRGARVFDPRTSTTAFSANLALCLRDYFIRGMGIPGSRIDNPSVSVAADICDETMSTKVGASIPRYHGALTYTYEEAPVDVARRFLAAMDGRIYLTPDAGRIALLAGKWVAPTVTITDDHVLEHELEDGAGAFATVNDITVKYTQADAAFAETTADPWRDEASVAVYGRLSQTMERYEVQHHNHARRLAKIQMHRANPRWHGKLTVTLFGLKCIDQRWISVVLPDLDIDEDFEITDWGLDLSNMTVVLKVRSFSAAAYNFDPNTEEGTAPAVPDDVDVAPVPTPDSVVLADVVRGGSDVLRLSVSPPPSPALEVKGQYRVDGGEWESIDMELVESTGNYKGFSGPVGSGEFDARARYNSLGRRGSWVASNTVTI